MIDEEEPRLLEDYSMPELQDLISVAYKSWKIEVDVEIKKKKKKQLLIIIRHYNKRANFKVYKETIL
jgi:hypothetical protein